MYRVRWCAVWGEIVCCDVWDVVDNEDTEEVLCVCVCVCVG